MKTLKKLGLRLQKIRKSLGLIQENIADERDINIPNLSNIENGKRFMTPENIEKIAKALDIEVKDLFDYEHHQSRKTLVEKINDFISTANSKDIEFVYRFTEKLKQYKK